MSGGTRYELNEWKNDCPRPLTQCDYPECTCDVDDDEESHQDR